MKEKIRVLIVDDEPLAREGIRTLLEKDPDVSIMGECSDGVEALQEIVEESPDLVFLDVQMPEVDGFGVLGALDPAQLPAVIFITAHDQYALDAFRIHALDYLLKPVDPERFLSALDHAKAEIRKKSTQALNEKLLEMLRAVKPPDRIVVKSGGRIIFLKTREILWIEAAGDYATIHAQSGKHLVRETMAVLERRLNPEQFIRIHRSTIVNLDCIKELEPKFHGEYVIRLRDGTPLILSRSYRERIEKLLRKPI